MLSHPPHTHNVIFCVLGRGIGNYRGSRSGKWQLDIVLYYQCNFMFDINATLTSNYILLFWFYVRSVPLIYGTGTIDWQNSALDRTSILFIKFQFYCGCFAAIQNWGILAMLLVCAFFRLSKVEFVSTFFSPRLIKSC